MRQQLRIEKQVSKIWRLGVRWSVALLIGLTTGPAFSALYDVSDVPIFTMEGIDPNILLTMDDSGSMAWSFMPNDVGDYPNSKRITSAAFNKLYYDPLVTYTPPVNEGGASLGNASFVSAWDDGFNKSGAGTCSVNLATTFRPSMGGIGTNHCGSSNSSDGFYRRYASSSSSVAGVAAYYHVFDATNTGCDGTVVDDDCYDKVVVSATSGPGGVDERINFANWYSYYRKRVYLAKSSASRAFSGLGVNVRVGYQRINGSTLMGVRQFTGASRKSFYDWLLALPAVGGTPLAAATKAAGDYFSTAEPYRDDPTDAGTPELSCRQNFHVMMTDGYWNGALGVTGNRDNSTQSIPANDYSVATYSPRAPFRDDNSSYIADNAFYYWYRDLRTGLPNNVPTHIVDTSTDVDGDGDVDDSDIFWNPKNDPAKWQHMVNFTIGLGVSGTLDYPADYNALLAGTKTWPGGAEAERVDDLWHSAINSRGEYLSAQNTDELVSSFRDIVKNIVDRTGSFAPVALNSGNISSGSTIFFARFQTNGWLGQLIANPISDGVVCGTTPIGDLCPVVWDAACGLTDGVCLATGGLEAWTRSNDRVIITRHGSTGDGIPFRWGSLASSQRDVLRDPDAAGPLTAKADPFGERRLNYLRGDRSYEAERGGEFRNRQGILGDIVLSNPTYIGAPIRRYLPSTLFPEGGSYAAFKVANSAREPVVYVGANDGMLHGFRAVDGREVLGFIPRTVFGHLGELSRTDYSHRNYVDGPQSEGDVFYDSAWHTLLVSGLGLGGQGYFALDVTNPAGFSEASAASIARWEFTDAVDADLGFSFSKPSISRLANGRWAVIAGNGLNATALDGNPSITGNAVIYILDAETGDIIKKLDTKVGMSADPEGLSRPNGIIGMRVIDLDGNAIADRVYAGDLFGNIWVFDISGVAPSTWKSPYSSGGKPEPLFSANRAGVSQSVTTNLQVDVHPTGLGVMVFFGTGRYLGLSDLADVETQSLYGVWDRFDTNGYLRSSLLEQSITTHTIGSGIDARVVTDYPIRWDDGALPVLADEKFGWYIDLPETGERVHQEPILRNDRVIFTTVTPSSDHCEAGGSSWLLEINAADGSRTNTGVFDYNGDRSINNGDLVEIDVDVYVHGSGIRKDATGIYTRPAVVIHPDGRTESKLVTTSAGSVLPILEDSGLNRRTPWRELR